MEEKESQSAKKGTDGSTRRGRRNRQNGLEPELRLVDINSNEEVDTDTLTISRFETLSASDYHLGVLAPMRIPAALSQRGYLGAIGSGVGALGSGLYTGVETVGQGVWDATLHPTRILGANRLFSGSDSVRSGKLGSEKTGSVKGGGYFSGWIPSFGTGKENEQLNDVATTQGMKIFIYSPYDCIVAVKRNLADRLQWLTKMEHYEQAWNLLDEHPEVVAPVSETSGDSSPPTPSKSSSIAKSSSMASPTPAHMRQQQATLAEFFADSSSVASSSKPKPKNSSAEKEKRRIGELWLQQLVSANQWGEAAEVAGKVLNTSARWEHWIWTFIRSNKFDEISPVVPTFQLIPPLPSLIFEIILGHYVSADREHFKELFDQWPSDLFEISSISNAIEDQLNSESASKESTDWRILQECLARLYLADGRYKDALRCYVRLQDADTAMAMIKEHHLVDAVADDIPGLVLLRISPEQLRTSTKEELEELSSEPIKILVDEARHGVVEPEQVVTQLEKSSLLLFLFLYLRALWRGEGTTHKPSAPRVGHMAAVTSLAADEGKVLVDQFADIAVELFSEYDRDLLMEFLHTSTSYTFDKATKVCERRHFVPELVYLLSKTGQLKKALFLIIDELNDVSKAIAFAKEQDDKGLWNDLLEYSMSRPTFISGLLAEIGTSIDPITLVKRIPSGLEVEGLKDGLKKMIREYDLQDSISYGAARVMSSEVAVGMETLRKGRRKGIKFDVISGTKKTRSSGNDTIKAPTDGGKGEEKPPVKHMEAQTGHCAGCMKAFVEDESETLVGFACGHAYHLSHLLHDPASSDDSSTLPPDTKETEVEDSPESTFTRTVGPKVTNARLLKDKIEAVGGCRICRARGTRLNWPGG
jgi:vacuolar protein sorting-associated protein 41